MDFNKAALDCLDKYTADHPGGLDELISQALRAAYVAGLKQGAKVVDDCRQAWFSPKDSLLQLAERAIIEEAKRVEEEERRLAPEPHTLTCEGCGRQVGALWNGLCTLCVFLND